MLHFYIYRLEDYSYCQIYVISFYSDILDHIQLLEDCIFSLPRMAGCCNKAESVRRGKSQSLLTDPSTKDGTLSRSRNVSSP
jgi:hypothetical protein